MSDKRLTKYVFKTVTDSVIHTPSTIVRSPCNTWAIFYLIHIAPPLPLGEGSSLNIVV